MKGKVAIVTGGSGGIGFAAAEALAEMGGDIALQYRSAEGMDERAAELGKRFNVKCKAYRCDVSDYEGVQKLVQDVKSEFGRIDVFIANVSLREGLFPNTSELTCISVLRLVWYARALFAT
jgi:sorbose reductase